jgi:hypothetical protein
MEKTHRHLFLEEAFQIFEERNAGKDYEWLSQSHTAFFSTYPRVSTFIASSSDVDRMKIIQIATMVQNK